MPRNPLVSALALAALLVSSTAAAVPSRLAYQGRLMKKDGAPETGTVSITFALYDAATGGTAKWTEDQSLATDTLVGDIQACFGQNFTIPGADGQSTAFVCWFKFSEPFSTDVASPSAVIVIGLEIRYRIRINQPEIAG